ncbi:MAG TPA: NDP-sugar synthase, partial [Myxococcota bacterium]|nr:NDP-sugar synthase [Myxococcota bacterium]
AALRAAPLPVDWLHERAPRGSGGGIAGARALLGEREPFLVLNGDMCLELDFAALLATHRANRTLATLALRDDERKGEFGSIGYDPTGSVCRFTDRIDLGGELGSGLFIGVQVMSPEMFARMPSGEAFEIIPDVYLPALRAGVRIGTFLQPATQPWWPVGTPGELLDANIAALRQEVGRGRDALRVAADARVEGQLVGPAWVGAGAVVARDARIGPHAVLCARAHVGAGARLVDSLALPGAEVAARSALERAIAFEKEVWRDG